MLGVRFELFSSDLDELVEFYTRVLRFELAVDQREEESAYVYLKRGTVRLGALAAWEAVDPRLRAVPQGIEIVLEVEDLVAERDAVLAAGWPLAEDITDRPWGLTDFRLFDPDGYYLRVTTGG